MIDVLESQLAMAETLSSVQLISTSGLTIGSTNLATFSAPVPAGNRTYTTGTFTMYNSDGTVFTTLAAATTQNVFVAAYNSSGFGLWLAYLGGAGTQAAAYSNIAVNPNTETIYVTGTTTSATLTMYNASGTSFTTYSKVGSADMFLAAYNSVGGGLWIANASATSATEFAASICVNNASGNIYLCGASTATGTLTFYNGGGASSGVTLTFTGSVPVYVAEYSYLGVCKWATKMDGASVSIVNVNYLFICVNPTSGYVFAQVTFNNHTVTLYNSSGSSSGTTLSSNGAADFACIAAYNSAGTIQWGTTVNGTSGNVFTGGICVNSLTGNVYAGGQFTANVTVFSAGNTSFKTITALNNAYLAGFTSAGIAFWATNIGGTAYSYGLCTNNGTGEVFSVGYFSTTITAYNSDTTAFGTTLTPVGSNDIYIVAYDNLVTNYALPTPGTDPTNKTLLFQNNATTQGVIYIIPASLAVISPTGLTVYKVYFTTTGQILNLTWTNSQWSVEDYTCTLITS